MNARSKIMLAALAASLLCRTGAPAFAATPAPPTPASLSPCAFTPAEMQAVFGLTLDRAERSDMTVPGGRDVGCLYTFQESSFELAVRQTWDDARPASASASEKGVTAIRGDPDGASWKAGAADRPGAGGELTYLRGKVRTRVLVRGGRLTGAEALQRLLLLRRVP